ncbi:hypothetical protein MF6394_21315 [Pseudomonas sp. MF6394]|nr:hypothetical protein MF6394_21315 [Pseudomonas sp. MF6394]
MDGAWRRPPKSLADYGHTEPRRGAEWWGKSVLLTFALSKVSRRQGGTLSSRYRSNGYVHNPAVLTVRPSSQASQLPHLDCGASGRYALAAGAVTGASSLATGPVLCQSDQGAFRELFSSTR